MFTIEPKRETIVKYSVTVTLDEEEIARILVDAKPFQAQLRGIRSGWHARVRWTTIPKKNSARGGRPKGPKHFKEPVAGRLTPCPKCGQKFKRLARHLVSCDGRDPLSLPTPAGE